MKEKLAIDSSVLIKVLLENKKIATFDSDFKRVDFLAVIELEG